MKKQKLKQSQTVDPDSDGSSDISHLRESKQCDPTGYIIHIQKQFVPPPLSVSATASGPRIIVNK